MLHEPSHGGQGICSLQLLFIEEFEALITKQIAAGFVIVRIARLTGFCSPAEWPIGLFTNKVLRRDVSFLKLPIAGIQLLPRQMLQTLSSPAYVHSKRSILQRLAAQWISEEVAGNGFAAQAALSCRLHQCYQSRQLSGEVLKTH